MTCRASQNSLQQPAQRHDCGSRGEQLDRQWLAANGRTDLVDLGFLPGVMRTSRVLRDR